MSEHKYIKDMDLFELRSAYLQINERCCELVRVIARNDARQQMAAFKEHREYTDKIDTEGFDVDKKIDLLPGLGNPKSLRETSEYFKERFDSLGEPDLDEEEIDESDKEELLHFYNFNFRGRCLSDGRESTATATGGWISKGVTLSRIASQKEYANMQPDSCLISVSYLGHMTAREFQGD